MSPAENSVAPRKRRWPWILASAVATVLIIGLLAPLFINVDKYRPQITAAISDATGRQVTLGAIHARLLPTAAVIVDGFELGNPKDFAPGSLLSVEKVRGGLTLSALLRGDIHVTSVTLVNPKLILEQDENGQTNYAFPSETSAKSGGAETNSASSFSLDAIEEISLQNADVSLEQIPARGAQPFVIIAAHKVNVEMGNVVLDANAIKQWSANANLSGVSVSSGALAIPAVFDSGEVKLAEGTLDANFRVIAGKVAEVKGTLHVPDVTHSVTTFDLSTPLLDANALLGAIRATPVTVPSSGASAAPVAALTDKLLAQGKLSADRVSWSPYLGGNAGAQISIYGDHMEIMPASMVLYGGTLQLSARTDARQNPERYSVNLQLNNLDLGRMLAVAPGGMKGKMTGLAEIELQLVGSAGANWQKSLTGGGNFSIRDGTLPGVNLGGALGVLAKAAGLKETSFKSIAGDLSADDGRVSTKQTTMDSSSGTVTLAGSFSIIDQSMSFDGKANLTPSGAAGAAVGVIAGFLGAASGKPINGITVPFSLRGTLSDPRFLPGKGAPSAGGSPASGTQKGDAIQSGLGKILGKHH